MENPAAVSIENPNILDAIQNAGFAIKNDILRAIAVAKTGVKLFEGFNIKVGTANKNIIQNNIKPTLPNSRVAVYFELSWTGTEPDILWNKINGNNSSPGIVLSTLQGSKVSGSDYQFDAVVTKDSEYNLQSDQTGVTLDYLLVVEYALGF